MRRTLQVIIQYEAFEEVTRFMTDELNILYVAMTRAQRRLFLSQKVWYYYDALDGEEIMGQFATTQP